MLRFCKKKLKTKEGGQNGKKKKRISCKRSEKVQRIFYPRDSSTGRLASSYRDRFRNISSEERVHREYHRIMNEIYDRNRDSYPNVVEERRELIESLEI